MSMAARDYRVAMRDGIHLATDVYLPEGEGPWVVILERTPYGKRRTNHADCSLAEPEPLPKPQIAARFVAAGFAYVLQDCRGRYDSEGEFEKYLNEGRDGEDTLAWIRRQNWCEGRVCTLGFSYGAHVQTALAAASPAGLAGMFIDSGGFSSAFHSGIRQGGAYELKQLTWALKHARLAAESNNDPLQREALAKQDIRHWIREVWTPGHSPLAAAPDYEAYVIEQWRRECFEPFWQRPELHALGHHAAFPDVPSVHMSSWFDPYALTATENFLGLARRHRSAVRLVLGPWIHGQRSISFAGDVDFGPAATLDGNLAPDYVTLRRDFFDRHVRGNDAPDWLSTPVAVFVMGGGDGGRNSAGRLQHGGRWLRAQQWPPEDTAATPWFLGEDGRLTPAPPACAVSAQWLHDPREPVPTIGGAITSGAPLMEGGAFDQRESPRFFGCSHSGRPLCERADVVSFRSAALEQDLEIAGPVSARLWVSSSCVDTDFVVKLIDEYPPNAAWPEGYAMNLTDGILRLRFRDSFEQAQLAEPGRIYPIDVVLPPTANRFVRGHRLRVDIASSNFPHFDVNPNSGAPAGTPSPPQIARNAVHMSPDMPSHLLLFARPAT
ncbi:MAG: CocE/NonD family hydrolase [Gammaproteobacteria bacterium]|nr:CocE/NonD family hydrolase [Gammaproteobacteria bacterium]